MNLKKKKHKIRWSSIVIIIIFCIIMSGILYYANKDMPHYTITPDSGVEYETARVLEVTEKNLTKDDSTEGMLKGSTELKIEILTGRYKSDVCFITNYYSSLYNVDVKKNDTLSIRIDTTAEGEYNVSVYNYNRIPLFFGLILAFFLCLILIGGKQGLKAFLGLVYTVICIFFILLPLCLKGFSPIPLTCAIVFITSFVCFYLIGGIQKKTVIAAIGSLSGVVVAALFAQISAMIGGVNTFQTDEAEALLLVKSSFPLQMRGLFISGILIAALGAVMDVSMTISSALKEIYDVNPELTRKDLILSGMKIGKDAMGTMANTLVLAYVGSSLNMMILIYSYGVTFTQLVNTDFVAIELIRAVAGSIGIILTVPCVSILSAFLYTTHKFSGYKQNN